MANLYVTGNLSFGWVMNTYPKSYQKITFYRHE